MGRHCHIFCEVEFAARIFGEDANTVEGWLDGGLLKGTFSSNRWLADSEDVLRLHLERFLAGSRKKPKNLGICSRQRLCDDIAAMNVKMISAFHSPRRAKLAKKLVGLLEEISVVATVGQRPPLPKKKTERELREAREKVDAGIRSNKRRREQAKNAEYYRRFRENIGKTFTPPCLPIDGKRFWWNEE
jgi:hypothetical protein